MAKKPLPQPMSYAYSGIFILLRDVYADNPFSHCEGTLKDMGKIDHYLTTIKQRPKPLAHFLRCMAFNEICHVVKTYALD